MSNDAFSGFERFDGFDGPEDGTKIVYGVNVLRVDATVTADPGGMCVQQLVEHYRQVFDLPAEVVVFVDGVKLSSDTIPAGAGRVEIVKPAGRKQRIDLADEDAFRVLVVRQDTVEYTTEVVDGEVPAALVTYITTLAAGRRLDGARVVHTEIRATRAKTRVEAEMTRRRAGGLTINDMLAGLKETPVEVCLNGKKLDGHCQTPEAGDNLVVILPGETRQESFGKWAADQRQEAFGAYWAAEIERDAAIEVRLQDLMAMNWAELKVLGTRLGVKVAGLGRTADAIQADILLEEFPELPSEFVEKWLTENAPEAVGDDGWDEDEDY